MIVKVEITGILKVHVLLMAMILSRRDPAWIKEGRNPVVPPLRGLCPP